MPMLMTSSWASLRAMTRYKPASSCHVEIVCVSDLLFAEVTVLATVMHSSSTFTCKQCAIHSAIMHSGLVERSLKKMYKPFVSHM